MENTITSETGQVCINMTAPHQAQYWADTLGVGTQILEEAVKAVGNGLERLDRYLEASQFKI